VLDVVNASTLDQSATNFGTSFTPQPSVGPTPTTAQANEIVIGDIGWNNKTVTVVANSAAFTPSVSPTILPEQQSGVTSLATAEEGGYQVVSSTGTWSFGLSLSATSAWTGVIATFH
jgi:peroxiredoxin